MLKSTTLLFVGALLLVHACPAAAQGASVELLGVASDTRVTQDKVQSPPGEDVLRRIGDDPADYGALLKEHDSGFDPYTDTPAFDNFRSRLGPTGDCMGISYMCRQLYLRARWHADQPQESGTAELWRVLASTLIRPTGERWVDIGGWANLREASQDARMQESLQKVMELGQLRNLHPQAIHTIIPVRGWAGQLEMLAHNFDEKKPCLIAMNTWPDPRGHVLLAYKALVFEKKSLVFIYDCNLGPDRADTEYQYRPGPHDSTYRSLFVYDNATNRVSFHRVYRKAIQYDYDNIYVYQNPDLDLIVSRLKNFLTDTLPGAIGDLVKKLPFV